MLGEFKVLCLCVWCWLMEYGGGVSPRFSCVTSEEESCSQELLQARRCSLVYLFSLYLKLSFPSLQLKPINVNVYKIKPIAVGLCSVRRWCCSGWWELDLREVKCLQSISPQEYFWKFKNFSIVDKRGYGCAFVMKRYEFNAHGKPKIRSSFCSRSVGNIAFSGQSSCLKTACFYYVSIGCSSNTLFLVLFKKEWTWGEDRITSRECRSRPGKILNSTMNGRESRGGGGRGE